MKLNKAILFASATLLLGSCGIYNKYERPEVNTKGLVRDVQSATDTVAVTDTASFGNLPWRSVFTDPQLQSLIEQGLAHNTNMLNAALNVKMVEEQLKVAKLAFVPSFTFSPQGVITSWDGNKATKTYSLPVQASWSIDLFGNLLNVKRSAQMNLLATKDYQLVVKTGLISNIANMYYTLMMLDKQLELVDNMTTLTKDTWELMKLQKELGRAKETSVQSAESNYYSVQAQAADLKRQIREAYRVNKHELLNILVERKCRLAIAFIYLSDQLVESSIIEDRMRIALVRITEKMAAPNTDMPSTTLEP